jgi:hypothetical protein
MSSDMARPVVVTEVTAARGAGFGPVQNHRLRSYSLGDGDVKAQLMPGATAEINPSTELAVVVGGRTEAAAGP